MSHRILTKHCSELNEGPLWHPDHGRVYWTDVRTGTIRAYDPATGQNEPVHQGTQVGGMTIQENGDLLLYREKGAIHLLRGAKVIPVIEDIPDERTTMFNDVAADPAGRVFCGTLPTADRRGRLYRLDPDLSLRIVVEDVGCTNGIGWSPDRKTMYYTDSEERTIYAFDYDLATGEIENRRDFFVVTTGGVPDGMTVDAEGHIWSAIWGGNCVLELDAAGNEVRRFELPAEKVSCVTFGGPDYRDMYVTTAGGDEPDALEGAGELIVMRPGARGIPEFRSRIRIDP